MPAAGDPIIAAAGDIACDPTSASFNGGQGTAAACQQMATSDIIENDPAIAAVLTLGDDQYGCGGFSAFEGSFDPSWGRFKAKIHPAPGNHEYQTSGGSDCAPNAAGYFRYFGAAAGNAQGDYAWNIGAWHMIALNGECTSVGGCDAGSPQGQFLQSHLGTSKCTLAYWHEPYYNGGGIASTKYAYFWQTLRAADADIILNGHIHTYARFAPQDANGNLDAARHPRVHRRHGRRGPRLAGRVDERPGQRGRRLRHPRADAPPRQLHLEDGLDDRRSARLRHSRL